MSNIVNRYTMRKHGVTELDIVMLQKKSMQFDSVTVFDKMVTTDRGYLSATPHFNLDEMIEAQKVFIAEVRASSVARNKELLKVLEDMREEIMSKKANILSDLESGMLVNMFDSLKRYGTSMRSRISELKAEGHKIESKVIDESGALAYFMPDYLKKGSVTADMV